ncbi:hypothetical protein FNV43_RR21210 [Rhamnella rubrinervis]|uniref:Uncharacterized protein n=1 Tax=Rhamnella rubrinervis TaxID=2594499 RepID=A0A8K0GV79_9ROSA|nr:hypothetical protein FNV43_RR21210 [Rhamnella rubrinervis]
MASIWGPTLVGESSRAHQDVLIMSEDEVGENKAKLEGLAEEIETFEKSNLGKGGENEEEPTIDAFMMTFSLKVSGTLWHYYAYKYKKFNKVVEGLSSPKSWAKRWFFMRGNCEGIGSSNGWSHRVPRTFCTPVWPKSRPRQPHTLLAKSNKILRLEVQCRMKKFILSPKHKTAYCLWANPEAEEDGIIVP